GWSICGSAERLDGCKGINHAIPKTVIHAWGAAVHCSQPQDVGNTRVTDRPRATASFDEQRRHGGDVWRCRRGAKERSKIRQRGADPTGGSHVGFGTQLMSWEKQLARSLRTKILERSKPCTMHIDRSHRDHITYAWMAENTATGDVVVEHCDPTKGIKIQCEGQGWSGHTIDHHAGRQRSSRRI